MNEPLAIGNIVIIVVTAAATLQGFRDPSWHDRLLFEPIHILRDKEFYRLLTSGLLHGDLMHFIFNMYSLYSFGSCLELLFGLKTFLPIYLSGIIGGNLLSLYLHRWHEYRALGASGGVCGVIFASIFLLPEGGIQMLFIPFTIPVTVYAILFLVISFLGMRSQSDNIGHDAHLGGALVGLLTATALHPHILPQSPWLYSAVVLITLLFFFYSYKYPISLQQHSPYTLTHWGQVWHDLKKVFQSPRTTTDPQKLDAILEKISRKGMHSLSPSSTVDGLKDGF